MADDLRSPDFANQAEARRHAPATARNRQPIFEVLRSVLPDTGVVLEIGAGTGEHVAYFAARLPGLVWQPSDVSDSALASIDAWRATAALANIRPPRRLDVTQPPWPGIAEESLDAIVCINVIHIAPWAVCCGLMAGAGTFLRPGAPLVLYGPFKRNGQHSAPSNAAFDRSLKQRDPRFGVRDLADVAAEAAGHGLALDTVVAMPANNLTVVFRRRATTLSQRP